MSIWQCESSRRIVSVLITAGVLVGCTSTKNVRVEYTRAQPVAEEPRPMVPTVAVAGGALAPGDFATPPEQLRKRPMLEDEVLAKEASYSVIDKANRDASDDPDASGYFNAVQVYQYQPGRLYRIYTAPMRITDIALRPGEHIVGEPASGDIVQWGMARGKSVDGGVEQQHLYLKPFRPGLETNLIINTDQRTYICLIHSYKETFMAGVQWRYPKEEMEALAARTNAEAEKRRTVTPVVSLDMLNFAYKIEVTDGHPRWTPSQAFDDGAKTIIRFPKAMAAREAPALFVLRNDQTQLVNYRVRSRPGAIGVDFEIDGLIDVAELRLGQDGGAEVVRVVRKGASQ